MEPMWHPNLVKFRMTGGGPELDAAELNEGDSFGVARYRPGGRWLRSAPKSSSANESVKMAMPGSLEMEGEYSPEPSLRPMDQWVVDEDDLMLAWEMATGLRMKRKPSRREMIQDYHADAAESWLVPKGRRAP